MAKFIKGEKDYMYFSIDHITRWYVRELAEFHYQLEIQLIDSYNSRPELGFYMGRYPNSKAAEDAVIHAMGLPGIVGVVPHGKEYVKDE